MYKDLIEHLIINRKIGSNLLDSLDALHIEDSNNVSAYDTPLFEIMENYEYMIFEVLYNLIFTDNENVELEDEFTEWYFAPLNNKLSILNYRDMYLKLGGTI
jgi:hypothetical protein